ncbi:MAG: hypothetical protein ACI8PZ_000211 [Myxococcota bacterium]
MRALWPLLLGGCLFSPAGKPVEVGTLGEPTITEFRLWCDHDRATWEVRIVADAWTGGATAQLTEDGLYVEKKNVDSVAIAEDGTRDELEATLPVADDWRDVGGRTTAFRCSDDPSILVVLAAVDGTPVDCRVLGPTPEVFAELGLGGCPVTAEREDRISP